MALFSSPASSAILQTAHGWFLTILRVGAQLQILEVKMVCTYLPSSKIIVGVAREKDISKEYDLIHALDPYPQMTICTYIRPL
jgi:hypothetical protein